VPDEQEITPSRGRKSPSVIILGEPGIYQKCWIGDRNLEPEPQPEAEEKAGGVFVGVVAAGTLFRCHYSVSESKIKI